MRSIAVNWIEQPLAEHDQRRHPRHDVGMNVRVLRPQLRRDGASVTDLSVYGCRIEALHAAVGEVLGLKFDTLSTIPARVVWATDSTVGCEFATPLHPAVVDHLVAAYARSARPGA